MKNIIPLLGIALLSIVTFVSCKKADNSSGTSNSSINATINGVAYNRSACVAVVTDTTLGIYGGATSTVNLTYPYIGLAVGKFKGVGTYTIPGVTGAFNNADVDSIGNGTYVYSGKYGTINITSITSTQVVGTFSFTDFDSTKVSNGSFTAVIGN